MARNPLDPFALNIGRLCHEWSTLESAVAVLFCEVAQIPAGPVRNMISCVDLRDQISAIKVGVVAVGADDARYWTGQVTEAVDYIDNVLRPRRNRHVHDSMWEGVFGVMRAGKAPKIQKPQAHQLPQLRTETRIENISDLRATLKSVKDTARWVWNLIELRSYRRRDGKPHAIWRPQLLPPLPTGTPLPKGF